MRAQSNAEEQRVTIVQLNQQIEHLKQALMYKEDQASNQGQQVLRLTEKNQEFQKELASVQAVLGRMKMDKKQLEETIGVVAGVVGRNNGSTPRDRFLESPTL